MAGWMSFIAAVAALFTPVSPLRWWPYARGLASAGGWIPSMLLCAILGIAVSSNFVIGQQNIPLPGRFNGLAWATWGVVAALAMLITCAQSAAAVFRLGPGGFVRPRWWFELARVSWSIATISIGGMLMWLLLNNQQRQFFRPVFAALYSTLGSSFAAFFVLATIGYLISFVVRAPRSGRAYDCVHYFYNILCPLGLVTYAAALLPPQPQPRAVGLSAAIGAVGVAWLGFAFVSIVRRWERLERSRV